MADKRVYKLNIKSSEVIFSKFSKKLIHEKLKMKDGVVLDWYYLDSSDSVLIAPITKENEVILINQNRFNLKRNVYEFPAGGIVGDLTKSNTKKSSIKELFEETGYIAQNLVSLGKFYVLPSETNRWVHIFLGLNVIKRAEPVLDNVIEKYFEIKIKKFKLNDLLEGKIILEGLEHNFALNLVQKYLEKIGKI